MEQFESLRTAFGDWIYQILPLSPFQRYIEDFAGLPYLGYLNWFFPIRECLVAMSIWLTVITTYFMYQWILRWISVVA